MMATRKQGVTVVSLRLSVSLQAAFSHWNELCALVVR